MIQPVKKHILVGFLAGWLGWWWRALGTHSYTLLLQGTLLLLLISLHDHHIMLIVPPPLAFIYSSAMYRICSTIQTWNKHISQFLPLLPYYYHHHQQHALLYITSHLSYIHNHIRVYLLRKFHFTLTRDVYVCSSYCIVTFGMDKMILIRLHTSKHLQQVMFEGDVERERLENQVHYILSFLSSCSSVNDIIIEHDHQIFFFV